MGLFIILVVLLGAVKTCGDIGDAVAPDSSDPSWPVVGSPAQCQARVLRFIDTRRYYLGEGGVVRPTRTALVRRVRPECEEADQEDAVADVARQVRDNWRDDQVYGR